MKGSHDRFPELSCRLRTAAGNNFSIPLHRIAGIIRSPSFEVTLYRGESCSSLPLEDSRVGQGNGSNTDSHGKTTSLPSLLLSPNLPDASISHQ